MNWQSFFVLYKCIKIKNIKNAIHTFNKPLIWKYVLKFCFIFFWVEWIRNARVKKSSLAHSFILNSFISIFCFICKKINNNIPKVFHWQIKVMWSNQLSHVMHVMPTKMQIKKAQNRKWYLWYNITHDCSKVNKLVMVSSGCKLSFGVTTWC